VYASAVLADGPIAYWRLGEASGTTAVDSSGQAHMGTYLGGVTLGVPAALVGDTDTAARFNGSNGMVQVPDSAPLRLNGSWSIEFWAKQVSYMNTYPGILSKGTDPTKASGYGIWSDSNGALWFMRANKVSGSGNGALTTAYRYFVLTYDAPSKKMRWYVNGALATTTTASLPTNSGTQPLQLGQGAGLFGNNDLDEVALYGAALSSTQVATHYAAGS
jgi:hypothetical protein